MNTLVGYLIGLLADPLRYGAPGQGPANFVLLWLAVSIALHSFPSSGDARSIWTGIWRKGTPVTAKLVGSPLVALIYLGAVGSIFWLDAAYGVGVVLAAQEARRHFL